MRITFEGHGEIAGLSERADGSMVWWNRLPPSDVVIANRNRFFEKVGVLPSRVVSGGLVHGTHVARVDREHAGEFLLNIDALITNVPDLYLTITAADCMPVYFFDPVSRSIGIAHAGWRGLVAGILENVIKAMVREYNAKPADIMVAFGPHIRVDHFEIGEEVAVKFHESAIQKRDENLFASLADEAVLRLQSVGVEKVASESACTYCSANTLYSARFDKKDPLEGAMGYIGMENKFE